MVQEKNKRKYESNAPINAVFTVEEFNNIGILIRWYQIWQGTPQTIKWNSYKKKVGRSWREN